MANQTLTTGTLSSRINYDGGTLSGLANGETITINGGHLLIDGDVRWGYNAAVFDSMTISATLGGSVLIDGTQVWEVPFSASTGNVPAAAAVGSNAVTGSGITGELLSVFATGALAPTAAAAAMPATGFIKLRSKTGDFSGGLVVTLPGGATVTCSGAGKRSWIHVVGEEAGTVTVPRLGTFTIQGDWYELGTTNGADDQTFNFPVADNCPAIQIETAEGSGVYEWWLNAGSRWGAATSYIPQDVRGKYFGMDNATGIITIARRATNACGFKPPTGCKVRVGNVICSNSNSTNYALNTLHATLATRYDFTTTAAGIVNIDKASCNWYVSLTNAFESTISNSGILQSVIFSNIAATLTLNDVAIGLNSTTEFSPITVANCFTAVNFTKVRAARYAGGASGNFVNLITDSANYTETDCEFNIFGSTTAVTRGSAIVQTHVLQRLVGTNQIIRPRMLGGYMNVMTCANVTISDTRYADAIVGSTTTTNGLTAININTGCVGVVVDGFSAYESIANVHPYTAIVGVASGSQGVEVRNIGTPAAPYDCGSANAAGVGISASVMVDLQVRRVYLQNTRTSPLSLANTVQNIIIDNVWGDATDAQALAGVNLTARGCRWTNSVTGQSSVYGRHWEDAWTSTTAGRILIACNEPLAATVDQCAITAGTASFTSGGQVAMATVGDEVIWTMPYFALGITGFSTTNPTVTGAGVAFVSGNNWTNFYLEFQWNTGSGFNGTWLPLNGATLNGIGAINPATGVKLKVRAKTKIASATNALTYIRIDTVTNATDQQTQYPLPRTELTIAGFQSGTDVVVFDATATPTGDGSNVLATGDAVTSPWVFDYEGSPQVTVGLFKNGYMPTYYRNIQLGTSNSTLAVSQLEDRVFA